MRNRVARPQLSARCQRVLEAVKGAGTVPDASEALLVAAAGSQAAAYQALVTLAGRDLVWWDEGGRRIRISQKGRLLLQIDRYRQRPAVRRA